jgi:hypothetical protein
MRSIVPGISLDDRGQAFIANDLQTVLIDLAIYLQEPTDLPVDVQHVVAAIIMAVNAGEIDPNLVLPPDDPSLHTVLAPHVQKIFGMHQGRLSVDD